MTVEQAVLRVIIDHYPSVKNALIQTAHPKHQLSGLTRLRGLKDKGIVSYQFDIETNEYYIFTPLNELVATLEKMLKGQRFAGLQGRVGSHKPDLAGSSPAPATKLQTVGASAVVSPAVRQWEIADEIKKFVESL